MEIGLGIGLLYPNKEKTLVQKAIDTLRRMNATSLYVPDDLGLVLGPDLAPGFGSSAGWSIGAGGALTGGKLVFTGMGTSVSAVYPVGSQQAKAYRVTYTIDSLTAGSIKLIASSGVSGTTRTAVGTYTELIIPTGTAGNIGWQPVSTFTGSISAWDVEEILSFGAITQDTTGQTPVTTINDLVGLLTDRLGSVIVPAVGDFGMPAGHDCIVSGVSSTGFTVTGGTTNTRVYVNLPPCVVGKTYRIQGLVQAVSASHVQVYSRAALNGLGVNVTNTGILTAGLPFSLEFTATNSAHCFLFTSGVSGSSYTVTNLKLQVGNHATQSAVASKPTLSRVLKRLGPNLVTNGGFDVDVIGWTGGGGATIAAVSGELQVTGTGVDYPAGRATAPVEAGKTYVVSGSVRSVSGVNAQLYFRPIGYDTSTGQASSVPTTSTSYQAFKGEVTATGPLLYVRATIAATASTGVAAFDNISVQEVLEWTPAIKLDGSNDLMTLSPGAILQQGSDHWVAAAFVLDAVGTTQCVYATHSTASTTPVVASVYITSAGLLGAYWRDDSGAARNPIFGTALTAGILYVAFIAKIGTDYKLWLNGVLRSTATGALGATTVNNATIGAEIDTTTKNYLNGKLIDIAISQSTLTEADRILIERNMGAKMGLTL